MFQNIYKNKKIIKNKTRDEECDVLQCSDHSLIHERMNECLFMKSGARYCL